MSAGAEAPTVDRRSQVFVTASGGTIGYAEFGPTTGTPVVYLHGMPGSRLEASLWEPEATRLGIRLIAVDRPDIGLSSREPGRSLTDYPAHLASLVQHLNLTDFYILGISGGGSHALACAAQHEQHFPSLKAVGVVAGVGPRNLTQEGMSLVQKLSFHAMDWVPTGAVRWFWDTMVGKKARDPDPAVLEKGIRKGISATRGPDAEIYKDEAVVQWTIDSLRGAFAQGSEGYVDDATVAAKPWGFEPEAITGMEVRLWYGEKDELAPLAVGKALANRISGAVLVGFDGESHLSTVVRHRDGILRQLCARIEGVSVGYDLAH